MDGDLCESACADFDAVLRVTARMLKPAASGMLRRALTTAPPCLPVAPVTRIVLRDMLELQSGKFVESEVRLFEENLLIDNRTSTWDPNIWRMPGRSY